MCEFFHGKSTQNPYKQLLTISNFPHKMRFWQAGVIGTYFFKASENDSPILIQGLLRKRSPAENQYEEK
jgi:hypothetical protein